MHSSLLKVENLLFSVKVRGSEYPELLLQREDEDMQQDDL